jgi:hypothetical protein
MSTAADSDAVESRVVLVSPLTRDLPNSRDEHNVSCSYNDSVDDNIRQPLGNSELFYFSFWHLQQHSERHC